MRRDPANSDSRCVGSDPRVLYLRSMPFLWALPNRPLFFRGGSGHVLLPLPERHATDGS